MAALAIGQGGEQDSLVEIRRGGGRWQRTEQLDEPGGATEFRCARGAASEVLAQRLGRCRGQLVEQEGVDEPAGVGAVERLARAIRGHTLLMTGRGRKVASGALCRIGSALQTTLGDERGT